MVEIIIVFERDYFLRDKGGTTVQMDNYLLQPGNYYILTNVGFFLKLLLITIGSIAVSNEPWLVCTILLKSRTRIAAFRNAVHERDQRCVITEESAVNARGDWIRSCTCLSTST